MLTYTDAFHGIVFPSIYLGLVNSTWCFISFVTYEDASDTTLINRQYLVLAITI